MLIAVRVSCSLGVIGTAGVLGSSAKKLVEGAGGVIDKIDKEGFENLLLAKRGEMVGLESE